MNKFLITGGLLSLIASGLHIAIIIGGGDMYRTFGAGEELAAMDEAGSWYPALLTFGIASVLFCVGNVCFFRRRADKEAAITSSGFGHHRCGVPYARVCTAPTLAGLPRKNG